MAGITGCGDIVIEWQARVIYNMKAAGLDFVNGRIKTLTDDGQLTELGEKYYYPALPPKF